LAAREAPAASQEAAVDSVAAVIAAVADTEGDKIIRSLSTQFNFL
jgi:hypothetical protein